MLTTFLSRLRRAWRRALWRDPCAGCVLLDGAPAGDPEHPCPVERKLQALNREMGADQGDVHWRAAADVRWCRHFYGRRGLR